jgi:uncharacterized SAM-binding protein YcdF (DUF218 family)
MLVRSLALFFAILAGLGVAGTAFDVGSDPTWLWLDVAHMNAPMRVAALLLIAASLATLAIGRAAGRAYVVPVAVSLVATADAARFYDLLRRDLIESAFPIAFSVLVAIAFAWMGWAMLQLRRRRRAPEKDAPSPDRSAADEPARRPSLTRRGARVATWTCLVGAWAIAFALLQMWCYGKTSYAREADAIVVLGARAYDDGRMSDALADRMRTGVRLFHEGRAPVLILSGGPNEPAAMRAYALSEGVPDDAMRLDPEGLNTRGTIRYLRQRHADDRVLAVSHFYHLPRIQVAARQAGCRVYTVPADESYTLSKMPVFVAREVVAFWAYLFR